MKRERIAEIVANLNHDHFLLNAIKQVNDVAGKAYELMDGAYEKGEMSHADHAHHGCVVGGSLSDAIEALMQVRESCGLIADDLRESFLAGKPGSKQAEAAE